MHKGIAVSQNTCILGPSISSSPHASQPRDSVMTVFIIKDLPRGRRASLSDG